MNASPTKSAIALALVAAVGAPGCLPYLYTEREPALIEGIDIDQSLDVAEDELADPDAFAVLTLWALRDQPITAEQAARIETLYLDHIEAIDDPELRGRKFAVWHLTWAIANLYRFGDREVRAALAEAQADAVERAATLGRSSVVEHVSGERIYSGPAHGGGRAYARKHLVVPGNEDYLQSYDEYLANRE